ncbi:MAG: cation:proton antiporter [Alphaproteobacteria bacterium]|nr:cation:proton antiporter [Alphaproteobacteria bacterium]
MGRYLTLGFVLAVIWLLLSGYFHNPLLLSLGAVSVLLSMYLGWRAGAIDEEGAPLSEFSWRIIPYWMWLGGEIAKANVAVAREALAVRPRLSPKIVRVPMTQTTNAGKVTFANSITLTPGTVSIELSKDEIIVHALTESLADMDGLADMGARVSRTERPRR